MTYNNETYLYFAENLGGDAAGDSAVWPASNFLGIDPTTATTTRISFKAMDGEGHDDIVDVTHVSGMYKQLCEALAICLNSTKPGLVVFMDEDNTIYHETLRERGVIDGSTQLNISLG